MLQKITSYIGSFNNIEKIYSLIFALSVVSGIVYGIIDKNYYKCCEDTLSLQPGEDNLTIFTRNILLAGAALITAGFSSFYFLFTTFAITSSSLASNDALLGIIFIPILGSVELLGVFLFGIAGFSVFERKILKVKSKLHTKKIILVATILIFVSALFEYLVVR